MLSTATFRLKMTRIHRQRWYFYVNSTAAVASFLLMYFLGMIPHVQSVINKQTTFNETFDWLKASDIQNTEVGMRCYKDRRHDASQRCFWHQKYEMKFKKGTSRPWVSRRWSDRMRLEMGDVSWKGERSHRLKANLFHNQAQSQNGLWTKRGVRGHSDSCCVCGRAGDCRPLHFCVMNGHACVWCRI